MINTQDNFTGDVIALLTYRDRQQVRELLADAGGDPEMIRESLIAVLSPIMNRCPAFVQQICARALMEHVDWQAVADAVLTDPEMN